MFWLDKGRLVMGGAADEVVHTYLALSQNLGPGTAPLAGLHDPAHRFGDGRIRYVAAALEDEHGTPVTRIDAGRRLVLRLTAEVHASCDDPVFGFVVRFGPQILYSTNSARLGQRVGTLLPGDRVMVEMPFTAALTNAHFIVDAAIADQGEGQAVDWINNLLSFTVENSACGDGLADLSAACRFTTQRAPEVEVEEGRAAAPRREP